MHLVPRGNSKSQWVPAPRPLLFQEPAACSEVPSVGQQLVHSTPRPVRNKATPQPGTSGLGSYPAGSSPLYSSGICTGDRTTQWTGLSLSRSHRVCRCRESGVVIVRLPGPQHKTTGWASPPREAALLGSGPTLCTLLSGHHHKPVAPAPWGPHTSPPASPAGPP